MNFQTLLSRFSSSEPSRGWTGEAAIDTGDVGDSSDARIGIDGRDRALAV